MFFVYILKSKLDSSFYIGFAENLKERLEKHNQGLVKSTKNLRPLELIPHPYLRVRDYEAYKSKEDALIREKRLKHFAKGFASLKGRLKYSLMLSLTLKASRVRDEG